MKNNLVISIIEFCLYLAISGIFFGYLIVYKKRNYNIKYANKKIISLIIVLLNLSLVPITISIILTSNKTTSLIMLILGFVILISVCSIIFFGLQYIIIGFSEKNIEFLGERIPFNKIERLTINETKNKYYIEYIEGRRGHKKYSFKMNTKAFDFIKSNQDTIKNRMDLSATSVKTEIDSKGSKPAASKSIHINKEVNNSKKDSSKSKDKKIK